MDTSLTTVEVVVGAWIVIATLVVVFMVRRGHNGIRWVILAFLFGPVSIVFAAWARHRAGAAKATVIEEGGRSLGPLHVVVGIDGSRESMEALESALVIMDSEIGVLSLAAVVDFESAAAREPGYARVEAEEALARAAALAEAQLGVAPQTIVLPGSAATALVSHAIETGADVLVIGRRGRGEADWLEGSVAKALENESRVRVAVLGGEPGA